MKGHMASPAFKEINDDLRDFLSNLFNSQSRDGNLSQEDILNYISAFTRFEKPLFKERMSEKKDVSSDGGRLRRE